MSKNKSQKVLNIIIVLLVIALIAMIGLVIYDSRNSNSEENNVDISKTEINQNQNNQVIEEEIKEEENNNNEEYVGEEEKESQEEATTELSNDEKALQLAKKEWGEDDNTVTYSIEEKKDNIYYIAVKSNATTISWYQVNTETWEISEFY